MKNYYMLQDALFSKNNFLLWGKMYVFDMHLKEEIRFDQGMQKNEPDEEKDFKLKGCGFINCLKKSLNGVGV